MSNGGNFGRYFTLLAAGAVLAGCASWSFSPPIKGNYVVEPWISPPRMRRRRRWIAPSRSCRPPAPSPATSPAITRASPTRWTGRCTITPGPTISRARGSRPRAAKRCRRRTTATGSFRLKCPTTSAAFWPMRGRASSPCSKATQRPRSRSRRPRPGQLRLLGRAHGAVLVAFTQRPPAARISRRHWLSSAGAGSGSGAGGRGPRSRLFRIRQAA